VAAAFREVKPAGNDGGEGCGRSGGDGLGGVLLRLLELSRLLLKLLLLLLCPLVVHEMSSS